MTSKPVNLTAYQEKMILGATKYETLFAFMPMRVKFKTEKYRSKILFKNIVKLPKIIFYYNKKMNNVNNKINCHQSNKLRIVFHPHNMKRVEIHISK